MRTLSAVPTTCRMVYNSTSELGTQLYSGQPAGSQWCPQWRSSTVLSVSVMQAGVTCTSFASFTAWKWRLEKKNHNPVSELVAYALMQTFSHASHRCGHNSLSPIGHEFVRRVMVVFLQSPHSSYVVSDACTGYNVLAFLCKYKILV